ncbi:MAG: helix-turn-helix domain-containing protein [Clostridia bacterium]|nr:helix-turn-helix domain-containing protein [Clostridia bacterium]
MAGYDLNYIAGSMGALSGVPVRLFENGERVFSSFPAKLPKDPFELYREEILSIRSHVGYFVSPLFHYYGIINFGESAMVFGPTSQIMAGEQELKELAFRLDVKRGDVRDFINGINGITRLPVESLLSILCTVNHFLNGGEKLALSDVAIYGGEQADIKAGVEKRRTERNFGEAPMEAHNTLALEETLMETVRMGDTVALKRWLAAAPAVRGGTIAPDQLRQLKNTFIVAVTLASRAAIRGGMREDDAFTLSDGYIKRAELLTDPPKIMNLQYNMIIEYAEQVEKLRRGTHGSKLAADAANYVRRHLSEHITAESMAEEFYLSRPYLSARFRAETGMTLTDFILGEKTEEAKRLLRYSDKSAAAIGAYLGFSSHSHFIRVFKKYAGVTPNEYREDPGSGS